MPCSLVRTTLYPGEAHITDAYRGGKRRVIGAFSVENGLTKPRGLERQKKLILNMCRHRLDITELIYICEAATPDNPV